MHSDWAHGAAGAPKGHLGRSNFDKAMYSWGGSTSDKAIFIGYLVMAKNFFEVFLNLPYKIIILQKKLNFTIKLSMVKKIS